VAAKGWWIGRAQWDEKTKTFRWPSGATITFGYLENENDKYRYQGAELHRIYLDELTQFPESAYLLPVQPPQAGRPELHPAGHAGGLDAPAPWRHPRGGALRRPAAAVFAEIAQKLPTSGGR
jgi:hypothetical protein